MLRDGWLASVGRRLFVRFYLYQLLVIVTSTATAFLVGSLFDKSTNRDRGAVVYVADWAVRELPDPVRLQHELDEMNRRFLIRATVFDAHGQVVAGTGSPLPPLAAKDVAKLGSVDALDVSDQTLAVGSTEGYAVASILLSQHPSRKFVLALLLPSLLAVGNLLLVRSIRRPLAKLSGAAEAFGAGDMRARAGLRRHDEVGDLARAFDRMADDVEAARKAERELLANVSHELRTPLARIRVVHELAAEKFPDVAQRYMTEIAEDLGELERLIDAVIQSARLDLGVDGGLPSSTLDIVPFAIGEYVEEVARNFAEAHPDRSVAMEIDHELSTRADRRMLRRAIGNVLTNADAYSTPKRGIRVVVAKDETERFVEIRIEDEGPGIAIADLPHIGTPFFRTDRSRSRNTGGTGLGLSLSRRILEAHRGTIRIASTPATGTTVTLLLPLTPV